MHPPKISSPYHLQINYGLTTDKQGVGIAMAWTFPHYAFIYLHIE